MSEPLGKWMRVQEETPAGHRTTKVWRVLGSDASTLGEIRWYAHWRQYTFWPNARAVLNATCLADLAAFAKKQTDEHRPSA